MSSNGTTLSTNGSQSHTASAKTSNGGPRVLEYADAQHAEDASQLIISAHGHKRRLVDGVVMPPYITTPRYHLSRTLRTKPTDICFVSYPKSGSTWLSYILVLLTSPAATSTATAEATRFATPCTGSRAPGRTPVPEKSWTRRRTRESSSRTCRTRWRLVGIRPRRRAGMST